MSARARAGRALFALAAALALAACQTLPAAPPWTPLAPDAPAVRERLVALREHAAARRSLRANARVSLAGAAGDSFSRQLVLAEREAKLRIEVIGLLGQRALVLASDGTMYDLYRAETGRTESGPVDAGVLWRVARIPLLPSEAVGLLLAAPAIPDELPRAAGGPAGELRLAWADRSVTLDASGALIEARVLAAPSGEELAVAKFGDWRGAAATAFPYRVELSFPLQKGSALIEFRDAELNAALDAKWFRLPSAQARVSSPPGEARP